MKPGFAKTRNELPWLYYPEADRVIINAHNFGGGGSIYSVNGKEPIAAWIPSLDDAGNGTTTLTDLVGDRNGTLTNFALTGSTSNWVADTGSGGVRALVTDGTNDYVSMGTGFATFSASLPFSVSAWVKTTKSTQIVVSKWGRLTANGWMLYIDSGKIRWGLLTSIGQGRYIRSTGASVNDGAWHQITATYDGSDTIAGLKIYADGSLHTSATVVDNGVGVLADNDFRLGITSGTVDAGGFFAGSLDDIRVFDSATDLADAQYLYNSGSGRGRTA
jgi:hypothetical protein